MGVLAATFGRTMTNAKMNARSNEYDVAQNAAEAAVEKVVARMGYDFQSYGPGGVFANLSLYQNAVPDEDTFWSTFAFSDGRGHANQTYVGMLTNNYTGVLPSQYPGLRHGPGPHLPDRVQRAICHRKRRGDRHRQEDVMLALVPSQPICHLLQRPAGIQHLRHHGGQRAGSRQRLHLHRHQRLAHLQRPG